MSFRVFLFLFVLVNIISCKGTAEGFISDEIHTYLLTGTVGKDYPCEMVLNRSSSGKVSGSYFYLSQKKVIELTGRAESVSSGLKCTLTETVSSPGQYDTAGRWSGVLSSEGVFTGVWKDKTGKRTLNFSLKVSEIPIQIGSREIVRRDSVPNIGPTLDIDINYPVLLSGKGKLKEIFKVWFEKGQQARADTFENIYRSYAKDTGFGNRSVSLNESFRVVRLTQKLLSINVSGYTYAGGAHGIPLLQGYNFDLVKGDSLVLKDVFDPQTKFLPFLSQYCTQVLTKEYGPDMLFPEGLAADPSNFSNFIFTPSGIVFQFAAYQAGPYVIGLPTVEIPFRELQPYLRPDFRP